MELYASLTLTCSIRTVPGLILFCVTGHILGEVWQSLGNLEMVRIQSTTFEDQSFV